MKRANALESYAARAALAAAALLAAALLWLVPMGLAAADGADEVPEATDLPAPAEAAAGEDGSGGVAQRP